MWQVSKELQAKATLKGLRVLVLIGVAAAFRTVALSHMTNSSVTSKLAEVNHPVACPLQWLPVLLATASTSDSSNQESVTLTPRPRCAVLLDRHVEKNAGSTLRSIFLENAHRDGWAYWGYG